MSIICLQARAQKWFYAKEKNISVIKMHTSLAFEIKATNVSKLHLKKASKSKNKRKIYVKTIIENICIYYMGSRTRTDHF